MRSHALWCGALLLFLASPPRASAGDPTPRVSQEQEAEQPTTRAVIQDLCWSPDGRFLYFSAMRVKPDFSNYAPELWTIYRFDLETKELEPLVHSAVYVAAAPDGEHLAISKNVDGRRIVQIVDRNGAGARTLLDDSASTAQPTWSPDGSRLAFIRTEGDTTEIYTAKADGTELAQLTHSQGAKAYNPAWSPDGEHITYFLEKGDSADQIHVIGADGTGDRNVTADGFHNVFPGWIDDETLIYASMHEQGHSQLYRVKLDGTHKDLLLGKDSGFGRYSLDGHHLAFVDAVERDIDVTTPTGNPLFEIDVPE